MEGLRSERVMERRTDMDIKKQIEALRPQLLEELAALVAVPSVMDSAHAGAQAPFGAGVRKAFDIFTAIAQAKGFTVRDIDGYAVDAQLGEGDDYIGVLGHLDVVEARDQRGWNSDPFVMRQEGDLVYGRGVNDDKGPLLAALYAAWLIKEQGLPLRHPIRIIAGGAEETTWACMEHYFQTNPQPLCGFSPDGNFPIVNGEKGILQVRFLFPMTPGVTLTCAKRVNFVCDDLQVVLPLHGSFASAAEKVEDAKETRLHYMGKSALSRNPQRGDNAIFHFVKDMEGIAVNGGLAAALTMIREQFLDDFYGEKSGLNAEDEAMGKNSICVMSMNTCAQGIEVCIDLRYVKSISETALMARLSQIAERYHASLDILRRKRLLYVDPDSELIQALKRAYARVMQEEAQVFTKGGASYARVLDHGVAFGATFDGEDPHPHMENECQRISSLLKACAIYYEALVELAVEKD